MAQPRERRLGAGVLLIVIGLALLAAQLFEGLDLSSWPLFLGVLFIVAYFMRKAYGFLVAGGILFGVGLGELGEHLFEMGDGAGSLGLGIGFLSIYVIDRFDRTDAPWWPLIPGLILLISGLESLGEEFSEAMSYVWPVLLILGGLALIFGLSRSKKAE